MVEIYPAKSHFSREIVTEIPVRATLREVFDKHILCLFFSTKALMCYVLNFFEKKPSCAYSAKWITLNFSAKAFVLAKLCLWCAYFFRQKASCAYWPYAYKKWVYLGSTVIRRVEIYYIIHSRELWTYKHLKVASQKTQNFYCCLYNHPTRPLGGKTQGLTQK